MSGVLLVIAGVALIWLMIFGSTFISSQATDVREAAIAATAFLIVMPIVGSVIYAALWLVMAGIERLP